MAWDALAGASEATVTFGLRVLHDLWPPDTSSIGPNLVASVIQWLVVGVVMVTLWPRVRHAAHRFIDAKLAPLHRSHADLHRKLDALQSQKGTAE